MPLVHASIKKLFFAEHGQPVLTGIDLTVEAGEFVVITGPVAAGKSVLCHCLTGAVPHFFPAVMEGHVVVDGSDLCKMPLPRIAGTVGYMMQEPQNQIFSLTVAEDVAFGPGNLSLERREITRRVAECLEFVGLAGMEERAPETLSGGEAQRAVLAGVLALKPKLLVLDQPTAELDPAGRREIISRLAALSRTGQVAVVMVADNPDEVIRYATRFLTMDNGRIVRDAKTPAAQTTTAQTTTAQAYTLGMQTRSAAKGTGRPGIHKAASAPVGEVAVSMDNCTYVYPDGRVGCRDVSMRLHRGELVALTGQNGSGKTTVAKQFGALIRPTSGRVSFYGQDMRNTDLRQIRRKTGFLFQNPDYQIFAGTVEEEAGFALKNRRLPNEDIKARVAEVLAAVGLNPYRSLHPHRLSRGQRQLLALASILVGSPEVVIADEPTAGLCRDDAHKIMSLLAGAAAGGAAVLVVTHDPGLASAYAHRLIAMHRQLAGMEGGV